MFEPMVPSFGKFWLHVGHRSLYLVETLNPIYSLVNYKIQPQFDGTRRKSGRNYLPNERTNTHTYMMPSKQSIFWPCRLRHSVDIGKRLRSRPFLSVVVFFCNEGAHHSRTKKINYNFGRTLTTILIQPNICYYQN